MKLSLLLTCMLLACSLLVQAHSFINHIPDVPDSNLTKSSQFVEEDQLPGVMYSSLAWGNYNSDQDLELIVMGFGSSSITSKVYYRFLSFTEQTSISLEGMAAGEARWGDLNNDGKVDIMMTGANYSLNGNPRVRIYQNAGYFNFYNIGNCGMTDIVYSSLDYSDFDQDGDMDILISGEVDNNIYTTKLYQNNGVWSFTEVVNAGLDTTVMGKVRWGDYNNDGYDDILFVSASGSKVYKNNGNSTFTHQTSITLESVDHSSADWVDVDNDGDLDIFLFGTNGSSTVVSKLYKNNGSAGFVEQTTTGIPNYTAGDASWGDYDQDGDLDVVIAGRKATGTSMSISTRIYKNNGNGYFTENTSAALKQLYNGSVEWGDYDYDGDLDIALSGTNDTSYFTVIYENTTPLGDLPPSIPQNISYDMSTQTLSWNASTDDNTPASALTYNVQIGTAHNKSMVMAGNIDHYNDLHQVVRRGNQGHGTSCLIDYPFHPDSTYIINVQAIDNTYKASAASSYQFVPPFSAQITQADTILNCGDSLQLGVNVLGSGSNITYQWGPASEFTDPSLQNPYIYPQGNTTYYVTVDNGSGQSFTDSIHIQTRITGLDFTSDAAAVVTFPYTVQFTNLSTNMSDYDFTWDFGDGTQVQDNSPTVSHNYPGTGMYTIKLHAKWKQSQCMDSLVKPDYITCGTSIGDKDKELLHFDVYPNPNEGEFILQISNPNASQYHLQVSTVLGEVVYQEVFQSLGRQHKQAIVLHDISKGIYLVKVSSQKKSAVKRIVVR